MDAGEVSHGEQGRAGRDGLAGLDGLVGDDAARGRDGRRVGDRLGQQVRGRAGLGGPGLGGPDLGGAGQPLELAHGFGRRGPLGLGDGQPGLRVVPLLGGDAPRPGQLAHPDGVVRGHLEAGLGLAQDGPGLLDVLRPGPFDEQGQLGLGQG